MVSSKNLFITIIVLLISNSGLFARHNATSAKTDRYVKQSSSLRSTSVEVDVPDLSVGKVEITQVFARSTKYHKTDPHADEDTRNERSSTSVKLRDPCEEYMRPVAADPKLYPYGTIIITPDGEVCIVYDVGGAVISRKAAIELGRRLNKGEAERNAPVFDFYSTRQIGENWDDFIVIKPADPNWFLSLKPSARAKYAKRSTWEPVLRKLKPQMLLASK